MTDGPHGVKPAFTSDGHNIYRNKRRAIDNGFLEFLRKTRQIVRNGQKKLEKSRANSRHTGLFLGRIGGRTAISPGIDEG
jgi:hypothetical protein